jgi:carboxypeptidase PM20D1
MSIALPLICCTLLALIAVVLIRTFTFTRPSERVEPGETLPVDASSAAEHLSAAIQCRTISQDSEHPAASGDLLELHDRLRAMYPTLHAHLERQVINTYSLLYRWPGTAPDLSPVLLMAHQDVVPVDPATLDQWQCPPFQGQRADGYVWGRGSLDIKNQIIGTMEAIEYLLQAGYAPQRTVYLGFGHDEEIGGHQGAARIAAWFREQNVHLEALVDEGGTVIEGALPGITGPVALIGNAEKGYVTLDLTVTCPAGHAAMPPRQTAIGILSQAIARLEAHPMPARVEVLEPLFRALGAAAPWLHRLAFANLWLLRPLVRRMLEASPQTNAAIRTTTAPTMISGGIKDNILPRSASAQINCRLLVGDSIQDVIAHARYAIDDERVQVRQAEGFGKEASDASSTRSPAYRALARTIKQVFGNIPVAPYLVVGATDACHFGEVCDHIYRFTPVLTKAEDLDRIHGTNERISIDSLAQMVQFYVLLLQAWAVPDREIGAAGPI